MDNNCTYTVRDEIKKKLKAGEVPELHGYCEYMAACRVLEVMKMNPNERKGYEYLELDVRVGRYFINNVLNKR
jgi:hypothetical protein